LACPERSRRISTEFCKGQRTAWLIAKKCLQDIFLTLCPLQM
jgi:hypothetical protein